MTSDQAGTIPEIISFTFNGESLTGYLYVPQGDGPFPCVLTNHGSGIEQGTSDLCRPGTAALLMSWGYASLLVHRHGYGESTGVPWQTEVNAEFGTETYDAQLVNRLTAEADDVVAAAEHIGTHGSVDADRMAVMGSSFGGTVTLWAATKTDQFRCAIDFAGAAINWDHTPRLRAAMTSAAEQTRCPLFFLQAENDYSTGPTRTLGQVASRDGYAIQSKVFPPFGLTADEGHFFEKYGTLLWGPSVRSFLDNWI